MNPFVKKPPLVILTGPTAVGKTKLSVQLAKAIGGEIICADSMQVYRHMDIGSAKIKKEQMQGIPHHMIDILDPCEEFNVALFQKYAKSYIADILQRGHIPILVGGTGFYIQAVLYDIDFTQEEKDDSYRTYLMELAENKGTQVLHQMLERVDEKAALEIHENNVKRVIRALEYYHKSGNAISLHNEQERRKEPVYDARYFILNEERDKIYEKINLRVDSMIEEGLVKEVQNLIDMNCNRDCISMQGLGYKEIYDYLVGEITLPEAVYRIKRDTRHFAKRQLTWFKRERGVIWINKEDYGHCEEDILAAMYSLIKKERENYENE